MIYVKDIIKICNGELFCGNLDLECRHFCKDTREIKDGDIYVGIKGENFKEGQYVVTIFSQDIANNQADNNVQDLGIAFAVDKTEPSIVVTGIEDNGTYEQTEKIINMDIQDNMYLESASIFINGEEKHSYNKEELTSVVSYKLTESDASMEILIVATDIVGNTCEKKFSNIFVGQTIKVKELQDIDTVGLAIEDSEVPLETALSESEQMERIYIWVFVFGMVAMMFALSAILLLKRKGKEEV